MNTLTWQWHAFDAMSVHTLHDMLQLREAVFVIEQDCVYDDIDGYDPLAMHLTARDGNMLLACLRVLPPGTRKPLPSIGRICTAAAVRGTGLGRELFSRGVDYTRQQWPKTAIFISAQEYLRRFYTEFGFVQTSPPYDEDGIMHIDMELAA